MYKIIITGKNSINIAKLEIFSSILNAIAALKEIYGDNTSTTEIYELKYGAHHDIEIDLDVYDKTNLEVGLIEKIKKEIYDNIYVTIRYNYKNNKGIKSLFEKKKDGEKRITIKDILDFMKKLPEKYMYEHQFIKIINMLLSSTKSNFNDSLKLFELLSHTEFIDVSRYIVDDLELYKIRINNEFSK